MEADQGRRAAIAAAQAEVRAIRPRLGLAQWWERAALLAALARLRAKRRGDGR